MKIEAPLTPQKPPAATAASTGRKTGRDPAPDEAQATAAKPVEARDTVEISAEAAALQSAADATKLAVDTRELIAGNNREAVLAQQVDVKRLQELVQNRGAAAAGVSITG